MALRPKLSSSLVEGGFRCNRLFGTRQYFHQHRRRCFFYDVSLVPSFSSSSISSPNVLRNNTTLTTTTSLSFILPEEFNNNPNQNYMLRHYHSSTTKSTRQQQGNSKSESSTAAKEDSDETSSSSSYEPPTFSEEKSTIINIKDRVKIIKDIKEKGIVHVVLSRSDKLNSLDMPMFEAIAEAASKLRDDTKLNKDMRVVIISGEGRAFCTGLDAKSMAMTGPKANINKLLERPSQYGGNENGISNLAQDVCYLWRILPIPVIAVLHGMCFGGGLQIALGADMRYATSDCRLSIMESRWGLIPDMGASIVLPGLVQMDVAKELTMTGKIISGIEAEKLGLITRYVDNPMDEALKVAKEIMERSPDSVATTKELYQSTWFEPNDEISLKKETELQMRLIGTWNQIAASSKNFGFNLPYYFTNNKNDKDK